MNNMMYLFINPKNCLYRSLYVWVAHLKFDLEFRMVFAQFNRFHLADNLGLLAMFSPKFGSET